MFVKSISFLLVHFVVLTTWQLIVNKEIKWIENIGICFIMFLIFLFYYWAKEPYEYKKENKK